MRKNLLAETFCDIERTTGTCYNFLRTLDLDDFGEKLSGHELAPN